MAPEKFHTSPRDVSRFDEFAVSNRTTPERMDNHLSLYVVAAGEHGSSADGYPDPISDITWLQFIDGLDMYVVAGGESDFFDTVVTDHDSPDNGLWLVDDAGTVHRQWSLPSERQEVLSIGRTVEQTIETWGDAK